jgi:threonine dehydrogenase-like Zn-dependent dehydrogenase
VIGVYPDTDRFFPIDMAMNKNLTVKMGNCPHRKYLPRLVELVKNGSIDPTAVLTKVEPLTSAIEAFQAFDQRQPGWIKVELEPAPAGQPA